MTSTKAPKTLVLTSTKNRVTTLTMNLPARLNGWTMEMMTALKSALRQAGSDPETSAVILTGADPYYSAGVNLGATLKLGHPRTLRALIIELNQNLFDTFLDFPKPILAAVNGPVIGAAMTSATLCDGILASERATFSTPFAALGVPPEGCSSVHFPRLLGAAAAARMLGAEGWKPTAAQALEVGLVQWVAPHESLLEEAQKIAEGWVEAGAVRGFRAGSTREELKAVNAKESVAVADAFLSTPFLDGQIRFLWKKKKRRPALMFLALRVTRPAWSLLLR